MWEKSQKMKWRRIEKIGSVQDRSKNSSIYGSTSRQNKWSRKKIKNRKLPLKEDLNVQFERAYCVPERKHPSKVIKYSS